MGRFQVIAAPAGQQSVVLFLVDTKEGKSWTYVPPSGPAVNGYWTDIPRVEHPQEFWRQALEQMSSVTCQTGSTATMRLMRLGVLGLILCLGAGLAGCCGPSALQADYGRSVTNNLAQQVVNPQAGRETAPAAGLTPTASTNVYGKYEKTFKAEEGKGAVQLITTK